ncbi:MAG: hypothetical protein A2365_01115 [Candidatus Nealsonbacteria bacterium RIFOXYB1_FULL_40_15]|uniref:BZIP domain-containing protein n=1 Tax=Candidatus Nealsonbacteria bacterium RIFOXYB1_FULL_40_15 TaxID=1801677 RepID=A0A1G2EMV0_9BACT|nr:MAG: hypothetical protein A2365_01115 [Candidatus Nealsonbacteria bacterium RIFOXYB1_FULL_40_15]OGZ28313.1 MAG: hypothetical protein A2562_01610 [Candidatus Nealsonbacteria bacterium RIFOXYD1_FULL_39_11]
MKKLIVVVLVVVLCSSAQAQFMGGRSNSRGGSYGNTGGAVYEDTETGVRMESGDILTTLVMGPKINEALRQKGEVIRAIAGSGSSEHYTDVLREPVYDRMVSIKLTQQAIAAQSAAEAKAEEASRQVSELQKQLQDLSAEVGILRQQNALLLRQNELLKEENTSLKAELSRLKKATPTAP